MAKIRRQDEKIVDVIEIKMENVEKLKALGCEIRFASSTNMRLKEGELAKAITVDEIEGRTGDFFIVHEGNRIEKLTSAEYHAQFDAD